MLSSSNELAASSLQSAQSLPAVLSNKFTIIPRLTARPTIKFVFPESTAVVAALLLAESASLSDADEPVALGIDVVTVTV
jgi:hypothetical protein